MDSIVCLRKKINERKRNAKIKNIFKLFDSSLSNDDMNDIVSVENIL